MKQEKLRSAQQSDLQENDQEEDSNQEMDKKQSQIVETGSVTAKGRHFIH